MLMVVLVSREKFGFDKSAIFLQESRTLSRQHICCWCGYCHPTHECESFSACGSSFMTCGSKCELSALLYAHRQMTGRRSKFFCRLYRSVIVFECEDVLIWQPKYYGESKTRMLEVLLGIHQQGCDFMVAGRKVDGRFKVCQSLWFSCSV
jgi:hypothetical protein